MSSTPVSKLFDHSKLILGSAQFGSHYGISNKNGETNINEVQDILNTALKNDINIVDTASGYGDSEKKIGSIQNPKLNIVTKISSIPKNLDDSQLFNWIEQSIENSMKNLRSEKIDTLLIHNINDLIGTRGEKIFDCLKEIKKDGSLDNIGYSVYTIDHIDNLYDKFTPDVVQIPMNILDNRFNSSGWTKKLISEGVLIHARSVFLQGLLLMNEKDRPLFFSQWSDLWDLWKKSLKQKNVSPLALCLMYMINQVNLNNISHFIVGINSKKNLEEIIEIIKEPVFDNIKSFNIKDENLLNPQLWRV